MYMDNTVQNGNEYCYEVTSVYSGDEGNPAGPVVLHLRRKLFMKLRMMMERMKQVLTQELLIHFV